MNNLPPLPRANTGADGFIPKPDEWNEVMSRIERVDKLSAGTGLLLSDGPTGKIISALASKGFQAAIIVCTAADGSNDISGQPDLYYFSPAIQTNSGSTSLPTYGPDGSGLVYIASLDAQYSIGTPRLPPGAPCIVFPGVDSAGNQTWRIIAADPTPNGQTCGDTSSKCLFRWTSTAACGGSMGTFSAWGSAAKDTASYPKCGGTVPKTCSWNLVVGSACVAEYFAFGDSSCISGIPTIDCTIDADCTDWPRDPDLPNWVPDTCCTQTPPSGTCGCVFTWFVAPACPSASPSGCPNGQNWGPISGPVPPECKPTTGLILGAWISNPAVPNGMMWQVTTGDTCAVSGSCSPAPCTTTPSGGPTCPPNTNPCPTNPNNCPPCIQVTVGTTVHQMNSTTSVSWTEAGTVNGISYDATYWYIGVGPDQWRVLRSGNPCPPLNWTAWTHIGSGSGSLNNVGACAPVTGCQPGFVCVPAPTAANLILGTDSTGKMIWLPQTNCGS